MDDQTGNKDKLIKRKYNWLLVFILLIVLWLITSYFWQLLSLKLAEIKPLEEDILSEELSTTAVLIKGETVVKTPLTGKIDYIADKGQRLRIGTAIARVTGEGNSVTVYSPKAGLFCTEVDGLEGVLNPANKNLLDLSIVEQLAFGNKTGLNNEIIQKGVPFAKLVDNLNPLLLFVFLEGENLGTVENLAEYDKLGIYWENERMTGTIIETRSRDDSCELLIEVSSYPEQILHYRQVEITFVVQEIKGFCVPQKALVFDNNRAGIFIVEKQFIKWEPVKIKGYLDESVILEGDALNYNTQYVVNPHRVKQGDRVW